MEVDATFARLVGLGEGVKVSRCVYEVFWGRGGVADVRGR